MGWIQPGLLAPKPVREENWQENKTETFVGGTVE